MHAHQGLYLECWGGPIKDKDRSDVVVEELTDPVEEEDEVGIGDRLPMPIPQTFHRLVQPDTHVWSVLVSMCMYVCECACIYVCTFMYMYICMYLCV